MIRCDSRRWCWSLVAAVIFLAGCAGKQVAPVAEPEASDAVSDQVDGQSGQGPAPVDPLVQQQFDTAVNAMRSGDKDSARTQFLTLHNAHPELSGPLLNLGILAREAGQMEEARNYFEKALEQNPASTEALNFLGVMSREDGEFEAAESYYRKALSLKENYAPAHLNLGILLELYRGRFEEALGHYEKYQNLQAEPDPLVDRWIADLKLRLR